MSTWVWVPVILACEGGLSAGDVTLAEKGSVPTETTGGALSGYLKMDSTRVSFGEYWRWKPGPTFLILAGCKLLRIRFPSVVLVPSVVSIELVEPFERPPELLAALEKPVRACQESGYQVGFWYGVPAIGTVASMGAALVDGIGTSVAMALACQTRDGMNREVQLGVASRLRSGGFVVTSSGRSLFDPAPEVDALALPGRSYGEVLAAHESRVSSRRNEMTSVGDMRELIRELEQGEITTGLARGIYVPASAEEVAKAFGKQNK